MTIEMGRGWILVLGLALACGGGDGDEGLDEESTGSEEAPLAQGDPHDPGVAPVVPPLGESASEAAHEAEYARGELHRLEVVLESHLAAEDIPCDEAASTRDEICDISERICGMDTSDLDIAVRCESGRHDCDEAKTSVGSACPG